MITLIFTAEWRPTLTNEFNVRRFYILSIGPYSAEAWPNGEWEVRRNGVQIGAGVPPEFITLEEAKAAAEACIKADHARRQAAVR